MRWPACSAFSSMLMRLQQQFNQPTLALHMGQNISPAHLGVLGYLILACSNLGEALIRMGRADLIGSTLARLLLELAGTLN